MYACFPFSNVCSDQFHLIDQETYLEDTCGQRWRVTVCIHNGSLAIRQGWPEFIRNMGVDVGNFLVFHYVPADKHFIVQIYGISACEKINFCSAINKGKQPEASNQEVKPLQKELAVLPKLGSLTGPLLPKFEAGITATNDMVSKPAQDIPPLGPKDEKFKEASQFGKLVHNQLLGIFVCFVYEYGWIQEKRNNNKKVIKSGPVGSEDSPSLNAVNYSSSW
ncbi:hypothetical protein HAX54_016196 [Datura stramonium]|uniref:TF-B3 domain-containing protein n=1 Tax=Datura stramonium TaxID=4076 RepID=A0ABS8Y447_DATST|nr:hypothetical protein [Datura stramonium]